MGFPLSFLEIFCNLMKETLMLINLIQSTNWKWGLVDSLSWPLSLLFFIHSSRIWSLSYTPHHCLIIIVSYFQVFQMCPFTCVSPTALKLGSITNFTVPFLVTRLIFLVISARRFYMKPKNAKCDHSPLLPFCRLAGCTAPLTWMSHGLWWKSSSLKGLKYAALITLQALET